MFNLTFPREVAVPDRVLVRTKEEYIKIINQQIKRTSIYTTVYNFKEFGLNQFNRLCPKYESAIIDRIYFDCDNHKYIKGKEIPVEGDGLFEVRKLHEWCKNNGGIKHLACLTGNGYNIYIATEPNYISNNKKDLVFNAQYFLNNKLEIYTDPQVIGDIARISRVPFTFNFKPNAMRWCIPLSEEMIYWDNNKIKEFAKKTENMIKIKNEKNYILGKKLWNIKEFDNKRFNKLNLEENDLDIVSKINPNSILSKINLPPCIIAMINKKELGFDERRILTIYLREQGFLYKEVEQIMKEILPENYFIHCMHECPGGQFAYVYKRDNLLFPNHNTMRKRGLCPFDKQCKMHI